MPLFRPPRAFLKLMAHQLGAPSGFLGRIVANKLNTGNYDWMVAAAGALELSDGQRAADVGFGGGAGLGLLLSAVGPAGSVHGVDPSSSMVERAGRTYASEVSSGRLEVHQGRMEALPLADGSVDGWMSLNTVYFVDDLSTAFRELARVLAPSGRGVIGLGDPESMAGLPFTEHGFRLRPVTDVVAALEAVGLSVEVRPVDNDAHPFRLLVCEPRS